MLSGRLGSQRCRSSGGVQIAGETLAALPTAGRSLPPIPFHRGSFVANVGRALNEAKDELPYLAGLGIKPQPQSIVAEYRFSVPGLPQPLRIRVEISLRERVLRTPAPISTARLAHPVGLEPVIVARLESAELLAEKVRALVMRRAGRDIYDVYWLLQRGVEFDPRLFLHKM